MNKERILVLHEKNVFTAYIICILTFNITTYFGYNFHEHTVGRVGTLYSEKVKTIVILITLTGQYLTSVIT